MTERLSNPGDPKWDRLTGPRGCPAKPSSRVQQSPASTSHSSFQAPRSIAFLSNARAATTSAAHRLFKGPSAVKIPLPRRLAIRWLPGFLFGCRGLKSCHHDRNPPALRPHLPHYHRARCPRGGSINPRRHRIRLETRRRPTRLWLLHLKHPEAAPERNPSNLTFLIASPAV